MFKETGPVNEGREDTAATLQRWRPQLCRIFLKVSKKISFPVQITAVKAQTRSFTRRMDWNSTGVDFTKHQDVISRRIKL